MATSTIELSLKIPDSDAGQRLDQALAALLPEYSRSRLKGWIETGEVRVDGNVRRPRDRVFGGEPVEVRAEVMAETAAEAQDIPLELVHEDEHLLVVDKPAGLVVHPGRRQSRSHPAECAACASTRRSPRCRAPGSCTASTRTRAACWWSRARSRRTPRWCATLEARDDRPRVRGDRARACSRPAERSTRPIGRHPTSARAWPCVRTAARRSRTTA